MEAFMYTEKLHKYDYEFWLNRVRSKQIIFHSSFNSQSFKYACVV